MEATIYLQPSDNSLKIAKFVKDNIDNILRAGVRVRMEKVPKDTSSYAFKKLDERGINRLPALVSGDVTRVGYDGIVDWFKAMRPIAPQQRIGRGRPQESSMEAFMQSALKMGDEETEEDGKDLARMAVQQAELRKSNTPRPRGRVAPIQDRGRAQEQPSEENVRRMQPAEGFNEQDEEDIIGAYLQSEARGSM